MTEPTTPTTPATPAAPAADAAGALPEPLVIRTRRARLSLVWLVPLLALAIGAWLVARAVLQAGPRIEIEFHTAEGLEAGKTEVRYKEVVIGRVDSVTLRDDRRHVVATVQLDRAAAGLAVEDTSFWVVRPRVGLGGVSGIGTLLSGAYIGVDAGRSTSARSAFVGLEAPPYVLRGEPGEVFILRARDLGSLDVGSPVYYRRIRVGRVVGYTLDAAADELSVKVFVEAPYQRLVTPQTRFWSASGIDLSVDANGLTLNTQTLATLLAGGVAFERPADAPPAPPAAGGSSFTLFSDRKTALALPRGEPLPVRMVFDGSLRGLSPGAPIDFLGVEIGSVRQIALQYDVQRQRFPVEVLADIYPQRLGAVQRGLAKGQAPSPAADQALLQRLADEGLRAQVRSGNLLTGQLYVAMDFHRQAAAAGKLQRQGGVLTLPTVPGTLSALQSQLAEIVQKISRLPLEEIGRGLADTLHRADATMQTLTPEAQGALAETRQTLAGVQALLAQLGPQAQRSLAELQRTLSTAQGALERLDRNLLDDNAPAQRQLDQALGEVQRAARALRQLVDQLQRHPESLLRGLPPDPALPASGRSP